MFKLGKNKKLVILYLKEKVSYINFRHLGPLLLNFSPWVISSKQGHFFIYVSYSLNTACYEILPVIHKLGF